MKSFSRFIVGIAGLALLAGCATSSKHDQAASTEIVEQPELEPEWGGYVKANYPSWRQHYWVDRGQWGNRGFLVGKAPTGEPSPIDAAMTPLPPVTQPTEAPTIVETPPPVVETPEKPSSYTVMKGDSLWRISGRMYNNPLRWPSIYRANQDKIKNPHRIYPGQVLTIPR